MYRQAGVSDIFILQSTASGSVPVHQAGTADHVSAVVPPLPLQADSSASNMGSQHPRRSTSPLPSGRSTGCSSTAWGEESHTARDSRPGTGASRAGAASVSHVELGTMPSGNRSSRGGAALSLETVSK